MRIFKPIKINPNLFEIVKSGTGLSGKHRKVKKVSEQIAAGQGYVTIKVMRANGKLETICENKKNLLTTSGRDFVHYQVYTSTTTGGSSSNTTATRGCGFIALTTDTNAPSASDTTLAQELASLGMSRADASTKTHTVNTNTTTIQNTFTASGTITAIVKAGLFNAASTGILVHENTFTTVTLVSGDTLQVTWTITAG